MSVFIAAPHTVDTAAGANCIPAFLSASHEYVYGGTPPVAGCAAIVAFSPWSITIVALTIIGGFNCGSIVDDVDDDEVDVVVAVVDDIVPTVVVVGVIVDVVVSVVEVVVDDVDVVGCVEVVPVVGNTVNCILPDTPMLPALSFTDTNA